MDVSSLREFYHGRLGETARRFITEKLGALGPAASGQSVMGLGYPVPYLEALAPEAARRIAFMPARAGVLHWPERGPVASALVDELDLPLVESAVDVALLIHGLELTDDPAEMLREVWRVLSPQGRLVLVVPNRRGLWAQFDHTPFGFGRPFSRSQLTELLRETLFIPKVWTQALSMAPAGGAISLKTAPAFERIGRYLSPGVAGVVIVEAVKQVYAVSGTKRARRLMPRFKPVLVPQPSRAARAGQRVNKI